MNWSVVAILVTVGLAQAGLVVTLLDRLFKAEVAILREAINGLKDELKQRRASDQVRDAAITKLKERVQRIEDRLKNCLDGDPGRCPD